MRRKSGHMELQSSETGMTAVAFGKAQRNPFVRIGQTKQQPAITVQGIGGVFHRCQDEDVIAVLIFAALTAMPE